MRNVALASIPVIPTFARDMHKEGWRLLEDTPFIERESIPDALEIVSFLKEGERHLTGDELFTRAKAMGLSFGQRYAETLIAHQALIPAEARGFLFPFLGTVWLDLFGERCVPYLVWRCERWDLRFRWLFCDWTSGDRLLRPCSGNRKERG